MKGQSHCARGKSPDRCPVPHSFLPLYSLVFLPGVGVALLCPKPTINLVPPRSPDSKGWLKRLSQKSLGSSSELGGGHIPVSVPVVSGQLVQSRDAQVPGWPA